jgi:TetR/AcrR family transcriptional regulator, transcriptional repressor for nem operon
VRGIKPTRQHIVEAADDLFYRHGFEHTSFAHIAEAVGISRGNFYHHFKSKDEILEAVIEARVASTHAMIDRYEVSGDRPSDRVRRFIEILRAHRRDIKRYGCPVGTLCSELAKLNHDARGRANALFTLLRAWLRRQFELMGRQGDADLLALHLLARTQGVATLANAFRDDAFIEYEIAQLFSWLDALQSQ